MRDTPYYLGNVFLLFISKLLPVLSFSARERAEGEVRGIITEISLHEDADKRRFLKRTNPFYWGISHFTPLPMGEGPVGQSAGRPVGQLWLLFYFFTTFTVL